MITQRWHVACVAQITMSKLGMNMDRKLAYAAAADAGAVRLRGAGEDFGVQFWTQPTEPSP